MNKIKDVNLSYPNFKENEISYNLKASGYILDKFENYIDFSKLIGNSYIDENYFTKIKLTGYIIEQNKDFHCIIHIFYNPYSKNYELKLYKHSIQLYTYKLTFYNETTEHRSSEICLENIDTYIMKELNQEKNNIEFVLTNINNKSLFVLNIIVL